MDKRESENRWAVAGSPKPPARVEARGSASAAGPARESSAATDKDGDLEALAGICANDWDEV